MRRLMFITLMAALWAWGAASQAAQYVWRQWSQPSQWNVVTETPACSAVAEKIVSRFNSVPHVMTGGGPVVDADAKAVWWWPGECSANTASLGDNLTFPISGQGVNSSGTAFDGSITGSVTLLSVIEDSRSDEVSALPVQRVLVLLGGALMFGLGVGVGRLR